MKNRDVFDYLQKLRQQQARNIPWIMEQSEQPTTDAPADETPIDEPVDAGTVDPTPETSQVSQEAVADIQKGAITLEMIIDKFNAIRSGRSFKEKSIKQQMMQYFDRLTDDEKVALYAFMKGIAQIVTGEFTGYQPVTPSSVEASGAAPVAPEAVEPPPPVPPAPAPTGETKPVPPAPAPPAPAPAPVKKLIKTVKPNIIRRQSSSVETPIAPKVRK